MGAFFSSIWDKLFGEEDKEFKILILGLDRAGKTTIIERVQGKEEEEPVPTIGYNHREIKINNVILKAWDLSGQKKMRKIWKHYFVSTCGVVFVIDSTDIERLEVARDELHFLLTEPELKNLPILILANKQDISGAIGYQALKTELALSEEDGK